MKELWHFSFHVADIDRSVTFYEGVLGLELVHRQDQSNEYTQALVGYSDASLRVAQFRIPGQPRATSTHDLELVEYVHPRGEPIGADRCRPGTGHLAFLVDDIHPIYQRLLEADVTFLSPPQEITAGVNRGGFACYFLDPDEITLEIVQPPRHASASEVE